MKVDVKKIDAVRRELRFEIPKERVSRKLDEVYEELGKVAKVKGFRPGKVPRHILESRHGKAAQEEAIRKLIPEAYEEAIEREKINPIVLPEILDVNFKDGIVTFTAQCDIRPEVKIGDYKGIKVTRKSSQVSEDEINKMLDYFKKQQGTDKEIAIDDTFARGLGFPDLEEFRKSLTQQLAVDKDRQNRMDVENQIVEHLLNHAKLMVPPSLLKKQLEHRLNEIKKRLKAQGASDEDIRKRQDEIHNELRESIEKDIRIYLILDRIRELEHIEVKEGEHLAAKVMEFLLKEAKWEV